MNKKRNRQKPTALEHIRVKKIEAELHHKEKLKRAMTKLSSMSKMQKLGLMAVGTDEIGGASADSKKATHFLQRGEMAKRERKKVLDKHLLQQQQLPRRAAEQSNEAAATMTTPAAQHSLQRPEHPSKVQPAKCAASPRVRRRSVTGLTVLVPELPEMSPEQVGSSDHSLARPSSLPCS